MAQVGGIIVTQMPDLPKGLRLCRTHNVKFRKPVVPGDQLIISCELLSIKDKDLARLKARRTLMGSWFEGINVLIS